MTGLCGWVGFGANNPTSKDLITRMSSSLTLLPDEKTQTSTVTNCALASHVVVPSSFFADDSTLVAVEGDPRWTDPTLEEFSKREGNAKALVKGFRQHGTAVLQYLHGAFTIALILEGGKETVLAIDRMGIRPLAYAFSNGSLTFGSTTDCVRKHPQISSTVDPNAIFSYIYFHMIPSPNTIYHEQHKLLPGQFLHLNQGDLQKKFYWEPSFQDKSDIPNKVLESDLHGLLRKAVSRCAQNEQTGAFLSGGIDSSTISGILGEVTHTPAKTYTIGFAAKGYDEMEFARITSQHFHTQQHEYYVTPKDVAQAIPSIAEAYDEPFGNASVVPAYYCARMAKEDGINAMLAGDGGDELFAGNSRYALQKVFEAYSFVPDGSLKRLFESAVLGLPGGDRVPLLRKARGYIRQAKTPLPDRLESFNFLHRTPLTEVFDPHFLASVDTKQPIELLQETYNRTQSDSKLNRMLFLDWKFTLADNDLRKVNRACELAGIKVHYPLLDDDLVNFSTRIPPDIKLKGLKLRYFIKKAMRDFLPQEIIKKRKQGFGLPFGLWLKTDPVLQQLAYDNLNDLKQRGYLRPDFIDQLIENHRHGHAAFYGGKVWVLMVLELWLKAHDIRVKQ